MPVNVFLSGAIEGCIEFGRIWRQQASDLLSIHGYRILDPMSVPIEGDEHNPVEIVDKNLFMQRRADLLLVEYELENRCYVGTDYEMAWAKIHGQPIIVICNNLNKDRVYLRYLATKIAPTLEDAVEYICSNYPNY